MNKLYKLNSKTFKKLENTDKIEKRAAIYRIFITINNKEYSYIGESKNWYVRLNCHKNYLKKAFEKKIIGAFSIKELLSLQSVPSRGANYYKMFLWSIYYHKNFEDFNFEILESYDPILHTDEIKYSKEQKYIEDYNSYKKGFNGINCWAIKKNQFLLFNKDPKKYSKKTYKIFELLDFYNNKTNKIAKEIKVILSQAKIVNSDSKYPVVPWLEWNLFSIIKGRYWDRFTRKILKENFNCEVIDQNKRMDFIIKKTLEKHFNFQIIKENQEVNFINKELETSELNRNYKKIKNYAIAFSIILFLIIFITMILSK